MSEDRIMTFAVIPVGDVPGLFSHLMDSDERYVIPLYQRAFAWEQEQLEQLIDDIRSFSQDGGAAHYYLGTLVVQRNGRRFEVIDGQQRLTALYLLLCAVRGIIERMGGDDASADGKAVFGNLVPLEYECRERASNALRRIGESGYSGSQPAEGDMDETVLVAFRTVERHLAQALWGDGQGSDKKATLAGFIENLRSTVIYRVEVPEGTDCNRYFEVMNNRGEQLKATDILKAQLMAPLDEARRRVFARVWDACSDMDRYVQMAFTGGAGKDRERFFGEDWNPAWNQFGFVWEVDAKESKGGAARSIEDIVAGEAPVGQGANREGQGNAGEDNHHYFESIIGFPYFLLHVLRVYVAEGLKKGIDDLMDEQGALLPLDDQRLLVAFENAREKVLKIGKDKFAEGFIECLLRCRYLFDRYVIKREFDDNSYPDGRWSLMTLQKGADYYTNYYANTEFAGGAENSRNLMIQACLRVSYTSPKNMRWITQLLYHLARNGAEGLLTEAERFAMRPVREFVKDDSRHSLGTGTPHIVFNYLDYILWRDDRNTDFEFRFSNSVEHWYPRNPSENTIEKLEREDGIDDFGNLCLVSASVNSRFSNLSPQSKKETFKTLVESGSLKLRKMGELTEPGKPWMAKSLNGKMEKQGAFKEHENEMLKKLRASFF